MIPFARVLNYGNIAPGLPELKKMAGWGGGYPLFVLYDNGELYGIGQSYYSFGDGVNANYTDWHLIRTDVDDIICNNADYYTIIRTKNQNYYISGARAPYLFPGSGLAADYPFVDITSQMIMPDASDIKKWVYSKGKLFAITSLNDLYVTGDTSYGASGSGKTGGINWTKVLSNVRNVACDAEGFYTWAVTLDNRVYRCGTNTRYTLVSPSNTMVYNTFTEYVSGNTYNNVSICGYTVYFEDTNNLISSVGMASSAVGNGSTSGNVIYPASGFTTLSALPSKFYASSAQYSGTIVHNGGKIFYSGDNGSGQAATGDYATKTYFTECIGISEVSSEIYSTGTNSVTIIMSAGKLYGAGYGAYIYGNTNGGTYINKFVEMKLPK